MLTGNQLIVVNPTRTSPVVPPLISNVPTGVALATTQNNAPTVKHRTLLFNIAFTPVLQAIRLRSSDIVSLKSSHARVKVLSGEKRDFEVNLVPVNNTTQY